jgi:hypothetical protein
MTAPEIRWPPQLLAFSITATETSSSDSISSGSSPGRCKGRLAAARPAVVADDRDPGLDQIVLTHQGTRMPSIEPIPR